MMKMKTLLTLLLVGVLVLAVGCQPADETPGEAAEEMGSVTLGYVSWDSEIASTNVLKVVLEDLGYDVDMMDVSAALLYQGVAEGDFDLTTAAWLPTTHGDYINQYGAGLDDLGPNLNGTRIGLVVPSFMDIDSIEDLATGEYAGTQITGIDPGAGIMQATEAAIDEYGLDYELLEGSDAAMAAALNDAISYDEEVIVTGWTPHWKFASYDLKYLEDPLGIYGSDEDIHTLARVGLEDDMPEVYAVASNFHWTPDDMAGVMVAISEGMGAEEAARQWVSENQDTVNGWLQ
ncbi:Substrate-binding region of ABC-type glycine betaine transport system [Alkaliphilus metalliredigens QYMF]|uniref:Substrate-binding region of ABC-type glycine betaine transport system n=1 Tax=Alkaliphilus metalliredigens (strain QYMF) TaxID=293826 RepID=A6TRZ2_ALKMQ|nr:glycine betaine ABC transporter substrate-binding protein [Alkaliphilus metalliredigens]ABR48960.1 Substrate-binding region of ABC-type glycine betaine transport system [Alkaliphilus metalliredigens QYMF]